METQAPPVVISKPSIWSAIGHFFHNVEVVISDAFVSLFGADAAHNFAAGAEALIKTQLGQLALAAVTEAQAVAAGTDKRAAAFSKIVSDAKTAGLDVKDSVVNMLIELCLQKVKGSFGAPSSSLDSGVTLPE